MEMIYIQIKKIIYNLIIATLNLFFIVMVDVKTHVILWINTRTIKVKVESGIVMV